MLRLVVPKGSLEKATLELFEAADLPIRRSSSVDYKASIDDPRIAEVRILRPQEIPEYVADKVAIAQRFAALSGEERMALVKKVAVFAEEGKVEYYKNEDLRKT